MISYSVTKDVVTSNGKKQYVEGYCLSTDTKPTTGIQNGSTLIEMNTGKIFMFDEAAGEWREF